MLSILTGVTAICIANCGPNPQGPAQWVVIPWPRMPAAEQPAPPPPPAPVVTAPAPRGTTYQWTPSIPRGGVVLPPNTPNPHLFAPWPDYTGKRR